MTSCCCRETHPAKVTRRNCRAADGECVRARVGRRRQLRRKRPVVTAGGCQNRQSERLHPATQRPEIVAESRGSSNGTLRRQQDCQQDDH